MGCIADKGGLPLVNGIEQGNIMEDCQHSRALMCDEHGEIDLENMRNAADRQCDADGYRFLLIQNLLRCI